MLIIPFIIKWNKQEGVTKPGAALSARHGSVRKLQRYVMIYHHDDRRHDGGSGGGGHLMHISRRDISLGRLIHLCRRDEGRTDGRGRRCGMQASDGRRNERWTPIPQSGRDGMTVQRPQATGRKARASERTCMGGRRLLQSLFCLAPCAGLGKKMSARLREIRLHVRGDTQPRFHY